MQRVAASQRSALSKILPKPSGPLAASLCEDQRRSFAQGFGGFNFGGGFGNMGGGFQQPPKGDSERFYNLLGVGKTASEDEIKKAYKKQAMKNHPDRGGDEAKFKDIARAYNVLSTPEKKAVYDQHGEEALDNMEKGGDAGAGPGGADPYDIFSQIFGFGAGGQRRPRGRPRTPDSTYELEVTLADLYLGTTREIIFKRDALCGTCSGVGGSERNTCNACQGTGAQVRMQQMGPFVQQVQHVCSACRGKGFSIPAKCVCADCKGKGLNKERKNFSVDVRKGLGDGHEFRFQGQADEAPDHDTGDVVIVIREKRHKAFHRSGDALVMSKKISLSEALCGFEFATPFLDGEDLTIRASPGQVLRPGDLMVIKGKGMPRQHGPEYGDLHLLLEIEFPEAIRPDAREKLLEVLGGKSLSEDPPDGTASARKVSGRQKQMLQQSWQQEAHNKQRRSNGQGQGQEQECNMQ